MRHGRTANRGNFIGPRRVIYRVKLFSVAVKISGAKQRKYPVSASPYCLLGNDLAR